MRILFFSDSFRPEVNAPASHVYERAKLWASWGHQVTVVTTAPNFPEGKVYAGYRNAWRHVEQMDGIRVVRVKSYVHANQGFLGRILDYVSFMASGFFFSQFEKRPDVVVSTSPQLFTAVAGVLYGMVRRVPHVFELRDLWPASIAGTGAMGRGRVYRALERLELWLYRRSARIESVTHSFVQDLVSRGVPEEKVDVVLNGANLDLFQPRERDEVLAASLGLQGRFVVGYLGTLGMAHGLENVLEAAQHLADTNVTFLFVGAGAESGKLESIARARRLENVVFVARQPKEEMPRYWSLCDASLIHLRDQEVFRTVIPTKIFESMAMEVPIVYVGRPGEATELIHRHSAGITVRPASPAALARAVRYLQEDRATRALLSAACRAAAPLYSRERHATGTLRVLEKAIEGRKRAAQPAPARRMAAGLAEALVDRPEEEPGAGTSGRGAQRGFEVPRGVQGGGPAAPAEVAVLEAEADPVPVEAVVTSRTASPAQTLPRMRATKRLFDIVGAGTGLALATPVLLAAIVLVSLSSRGPVLVRLPRVGRGGRPLWVWKLRTLAADAGGPSLVPSTDPRMTRFGARLRRYKVDELPQLAQVLTGSLSLVGPRPKSPEHAALTPDEYAAVLDLTPGLTNPAAIQYRDKARLLAAVENPMEVYRTVILPESARVNLEYAARATVWTDFRVVAATLLRVALPARRVWTIVRALVPVAIRDGMATDEGMRG